MIFVKLNKVQLKNKQSNGNDDQTCRLKRRRLKMGHSEEGGGGGERKAARVRICEVKNERGRLIYRWAVGEE